MPDISSESAHKFWRKYPNPTVYKVLSFMEGVEDWTIDGDAELEKLLTELGNTLDKTGAVDLQDEDTFIQLSAHIKMGRALRLLQAMDAAYPGAAAKLLTYAETTPEENNSDTKLFLRRNIVFERLRLLSRIFSENRLTTILKVLEGK